jgi:hypothetical protein
VSRWRPKRVLNLDVGLLARRDGPHSRPQGRKLSSLRCWSVAYPNIGVTAATAVLVSGLPGLPRPGGVFTAAVAGRICQGWTYEIGA